MDKNNKIFPTVKIPKEICTECFEHFTYQCIQKEDTSLIFNTYFCSHTKIFIMQNFTTGKITVINDVSEEKYNILIGILEKGLKENFKRTAILIPFREIPHTKISPC